MLERRLQAVRGQYRQASDDMLNCRQNQCQCQPDQAHNQLQAHRWHPAAALALACARRPATSSSPSLDFANTRPSPGSRQFCRSSGAVPSRTYILRYGAAHQYRAIQQAPCTQLQHGDNVSEGQQRLMCCNRGLAAGPAPWPRTLAPHPGPAPWQQCFVPACLPAVGFGAPKASHWPCAPCPGSTPSMLTCRGSWGLPRT